MRTDAESIFRAGLRAVDPAEAVRRMCRREKEQLWFGDHMLDLQRIDRILVLGAGKATAGMARAVEDLLDARISDGLISVKYGHGSALRRIRCIEAGHPGPDENGLSAARAMLEMAARAREQDLIITLLSGGGSALLPLPAPGLTLLDKQAATDLLLACGATIHEINAIRKHLSAIKGGRLAQAASPAGVVTLILSDVVGDDLDAIASGPTVPDGSTFGDCQEIIQRYRIAAKLPPAVRAHLEAGARGQTAETPKRHALAWKHVHNIIVGSNRVALEAAARQAAVLGYRPHVLSASIQGETRTVAQVHAAIARDVLAGASTIAPPACILSGGETTVTIRGSGRGGRNQEFALAAAQEIEGRDAIAILSAGTDGTDGPTDAAGALADHTTAARARQAGMDIRAHLENNDAYPFFRKLGDLLTTGPTGTNVMDLNIMVIRSPQ
ncbi:MAG: glycerate kinase [Desulfobacteraceae bacterium]|nr:MAG: glycerate kinase [Desulfobacteraceae bacterium]